MLSMERLFERFISYAKTDSETGNEQAMGRRLVQELQHIGLGVSTDCAGESFGSNGFNVFADIQGTLPGEPILLTAHMDTVKPGCGIRPILSDGVIHTDGSTILSSDDKSGICAIMETLYTVKERGLPHRSVEILFTVGEEGGMRGAKFFDVSKLKSRCAFVFDSNGPVGGIVAAAPGQIKIKAEVIGRAAHAGLAPETGISAIQVISHAISRMKLLRVDEETTCNIGTLFSEYATNIVPERAMLLGEVRSRSTEKLEKHTEHICQCLQETCDRFGATLASDCFLNYPAFALSPDCKTVKLAEKAIRSIGRQPEVQSGNGGSDANIFNSRGIEAVALATGMENVHTCQETLLMTELKKSAELAFALLTGKDV